MAGGTRQVIWTQAAQDHLEEVLRARVKITGSRSGIQAKHARRLRLILSNLDQAESPEDMDLPGLALHGLKGSRKGVWAVKVSGNWRVTFRFVGRDAETVNYENYH